MFSGHRDPGGLWIKNTPQKVFHHLYLYYIYILSRLHFNAKEPWLYPGAGVLVGVRMQNVRASVEI